MSILKLTAIFCAVFSIFSTGCATYVNIPALRGDLAWHSPNHSDVLKVQTAAIAASAADWSQGQVYGVSPLPNTQSMRYFEMIKKIGPQATADPSEDAPTLDVRQLYIRGFYAHVDVVRQLSPAPDAPQADSTGSPKTADSHQAVQDPQLAPGRWTTPYAYATDLNHIALPGLSLEKRHLVTVYLKWTPFVGWQATRTRVWRINVEQALRISALDQLPQQLPMHNQAQSDANWQSNTSTEPQL